MNLIPDKELKGNAVMNLTPMVDFLFVLIAIFATLAVTRTVLFDSEVKLAKVQAEQTPSPPLHQDLHIVNLSITKNGEYKWITEFNEYAMDGIQGIIQELAKQEHIGLLPADKTKTKILLHVDKKAEWDPAIQLIYALKKTGYPIHPVYESEDAS